MVRDLSDAFGWLEKLERKVSRIYSGAMLENSSITNGRLRLIGGLLLVDSGGRVEIVGTLQIAGTTTVTGRFEMTGDFEVSGPWKFTGPGEITGDFDISGDVMITGKVTQVGDMDVDGVLSVRGDGWSITGNGEISGNVELTGDLIVRDGGQIRVGDVVITDEQGGSLNAPVQIVMVTPLLEVQGGLRVNQGAIFDGQITANGLIPMPVSDFSPDAIPGTLVLDSAKRVRVLVA